MRGCLCLRPHCEQFSPSICTGTSLGPRTLPPLRPLLLSLWWSGLRSSTRYEVYYQPLQALHYAEDSNSTIWTSKNETAIIKECMFQSVPLSLPSLVSCLRMGVVPLALLTTRQRNAKCWLKSKWYIYSHSALVLKCCIWSLVLLCTTSWQHDCFLLDLVTLSVAYEVTVKTLSVAWPSSWR